MFEIESERLHAAAIKVVGVGGAGGNAVNRMIAGDLTGVEFLVANTDVQALEQSRAQHKLQLGPQRTKGLGSGGDPSIGRAAAEEDESIIHDAVEGADMVFITAGMGGGTGTGAAPVVAKIARQTGALTVAVVSRPFVFEGQRRSSQAESGLDDLRNEVDTLIVIPNERLLQVVDRDTPLTDAFAVADEVLLKATKGISDLVTVPGLVNLDFADVKSIMQNKGNALMGTGRASGAERARAAAEQAVASPLLEDISVQGATGVLLNITGGRDLTLHDVNEASEVVTQASGTEANVIFGAVIDPTLESEMIVTVIATGFDENYQPRRRTVTVRREEPRMEPQMAGRNGDPMPVGSGGEENGSFPSQPARRAGFWSKRTNGRDVPLPVGHDQLDVPAFLRRQSSE